MRRFLVSMRSSRGKHPREGSWVTASSTRLDAVQQYESQKIPARHRPRRLIDSQRPEPLGAPIILRLKESETVSG